MAVKTFDEVWTDEKKKSFDDIWGNTYQTEEDAMREIQQNSPFYYATHKPEATPLENRYIKTGNKDFDLGYVGERAWKGIVDSASGLLNAGANILDNPVQSIDSIVRIIPDDVAKKLDEGNFLDDLASAGKKAAQNMSYYARSSDYDSSKMNPMERFLGDTAGAIGGMVPSIATGAVAGPAAGLAVMGTSVFGNSLDKALDEGAEFDNAVLYGIASAGVELATEKLVGGMPFLGKGLLDDVTKEWLGSKLASGTGKAVLNYVKEAVGEGAEEYVSEIAGEFLTDIYSDAKDEEEIVDRLLKVQPDAFYSFLLGSASGGVMGAPGLANDIRRGAGGELSQTQTTTEAQEQPNVQPNVQPVIDPTTTVQTDPIKAQIEAQAKAEAETFVNSIGQNTINNDYLSEGLNSDDPIIRMESQRINSENIKKTAKKLNITKQVDEIIEVSNKLGKTVEFTEDYIDQKALGANTGSKIILSKKSGDMIQQIFVHELTHDAENSQLYSELETELSNLAAVNGVDITALTEQIIRDYAEQGVALDDIGARAEVNARIAQEYLFKETGIKQLANSNPNLAQRVFDWIRSLRIRLSGTAAEKQLLKTEQLYKKAINETAINTKTQYSMSNKEFREENGVVIFNGENFKGLYSNSGKGLAGELRNYLKKKYSGKYIYVGKLYDAYFNGTSAQEYAYPPTRRDYHDYPQLETKANIAVDLNKLVENAQFIGNEPDDGRHVRAINGWDNFKVKFGIENNGAVDYFDGIIKVMITDRGPLFYDITQIKRSRDPQGSTSQLSASNNSISESSEKDNTEQLYKKAISELSKNKASSKYAINTSDFKLNSEVLNTKYTEDEKTRILRNQTHHFLSDMSVEEFYNKYKNAPEEHRLYLGKLNNKLASKLFDDLGIDYDGYSLSLSSSGVSHANDVHGVEGKKSSKDSKKIDISVLQNLSNILQNYDRVEMRKVGNQNRLVFETDTDSDYGYRTIELVPKRGKELTLYNIFTYEKKGTNRVPNTANAAPSFTATKGAGSLDVPNNSISNSSENSNKQHAEISNMDSNDIKFAIDSSILERSKDPAVRARSQMEKRIRHTFLFNSKSNPVKMYDVTSRIQDEFERTGKISDELRKELFNTAYEETLRSSDVSYKDLPEFKQMIQEDLNRAVDNYENTLIKERELKKFAEENDIDASQIKLNPATGFLKNVKPQDLPDKIISYKKLKASLKSDLIGEVENYAGGKTIDELIDKAAIEIVEDGFISSPTKFKIRQEMIENGYSINADAMNDNKELYDFIKSTKFNVPRGFGKEIQDYEGARKLLKTSTQDGQSIDKVYQELRSKFGEFFPDDLTNPADQYQQIADVMAELEPTRMMLEDSEMYNAEMRQYLEDTFTDRLEDFKNQVLYRSQKDYYDRAARKQVAYDEAINQVSDKISEKVFKDNQEIDELKKSEHIIKAASSEELAEIVVKIQDRGALSKTLAQNLDAMANGDVVLRAKLSEIFEKPLREAKKSYVTNQKRVLNDVYKRIVTDLGIKMGSKESAAMMWYGEGKKPLNNDKGKKNFEIGEDGKKKSIKIEFKKYTLDDLKNEFPESWRNIVEADRIMRKYYDDYVDRINESLQKVYAESVLKESVNEKRTQIQKDIREAQERLEQLKSQRTGEVGVPDLEAKINAQRKRITELSRQFNNVAEDVYRNKRLKKRSDYYHHFQEVGFAENIEQILNVDSANNIANALAGISEYTKPKSKWEKFMQKRSDVARYEEDAIKGFLKYAPAAEYKIAFDPYVAQMRGTIQDMIKLSDEANMNNAKAINWLTNYTNSLAGKTNPMDRWIANTENGRNVLKLLNKVNSRVKANAVVGNLNSAVSQFYNLPNGTAVLTANGGAKAMADIAKGSKDYSAYVAKKMSGQDVSDSPINQSIFLQERFIDSTIDQFDERLIHKPAQAATFLLTFGDQVVAEQLWFSAYEQGLRLNKNDPIAYADDLVARAVGGRGIGEVPLMQQSQIVKLIAPFQVEVNNAYQLMKQLGGGALKDKDKLMALVVMYGITWIMNEINEALTGNRVGMDIFNALEDVVENWDDEKNVVTNTFSASGRLGGEVLSNVPMGAQVAQMVVPDEYDREKLFGEADPSRYGTGNIGINAIMDPITQLATGQNVDWQSVLFNFGTPYGGKQLSRIYKMAEDTGVIPRFDFSTEDIMQFSHKPGAYNDKGQLKYQIDTSDPLNMAKGFAFGTYATNEGKEYLDNEYNALSEKKTEIYEKAIKEGADSVAFYQALREANAQKNLTDKNGDSINNSKAAFNRAALERNGVFDDVSRLINNDQATVTDFGMNQTVFEWSQATFEQFLKSLQTKR